MPKLALGSGGPEQDQHEEEAEAKVQNEVARAELLSLPEEIAGDLDRELDDAARKEVSTIEAAFPRLAEFCWNKDADDDPSPDWDPDSEGGCRIGKDV